MKRILSLVLAAALAAGVAVAVLLDRAAGPPSRTQPVRGVIGSEKQAFFDDPAVRAAFARHGLRVQADPAGSRQIATSVDLGRYDFAFPGSSPAADRIRQRRQVTARYSPFSTPMAIATFEPIAALLRAEGVIGRAADGTWTFDVARYLDLARRRVRWDQLDDNAVYPVRKDVLVSTTDPRSSNSAAMYLAITSFVANGSAVVRDAEAEARVLPLMGRLFHDQGYTESTSEGPFEDYLSVGMGQAPLVCVYEAQFVGRAVQGQIKPGMLLAYPVPTVISRHTLVPLTPAGDRVGRLLTTDPQLQRLAARHGFRTADAAQFARVTAEHRVPVTANLVNVVDTPSYDALESLLRGIEKGYGDGTP
ncbi:hypothetical protein SAMN04489712_103358 [Thermomonospora echinospora]|uniref:Extracellular solute-binding protein n=1 Tax=Thermomonospora echinospora TaxID=1992 RepID=A0A1H5XR46_9ACTN|nr:hypothetical protein [Thermomonospora echinospora]SEG13880.1 hypothetical protein SAMN04489712_103358 [Thermomonospora echinospora]